MREVGERCEALVVLGCTGLLIGNAAGEAHGVQWAIPHAMAALQSSV